MNNTIKIFNANENNLKNVSLEIPKNENQKFSNSDYYTIIIYFM